MTRIFRVQEARKLHESLVEPTPRNDAPNSRRPGQRCLSADESVPASGGKLGEAVQVELIIAKDVSAGSAESEPPIDIASQHDAAPIQGCATRRSMLTSTLA